ncbi:MAG: twin-arginine translocation signal domain-containing protein [Bacteroidetes bacterium]|nr:twin-arginine translocation signal domain-containing protein [Bacteroidota bacterium]
MQRRTFLKSSAALGAASLLPWKAIPAASSPAEAPSDEWLQDAVSEARALGAEQAEALYISHRQQSLQVRKDGVHSISDSEEAGTTLRVRFGSFLGSASVPDIRRGTPAECARAAVECAKLQQGLQKEREEALAMPPEPDIKILPRIDSVGELQGSWRPEGIEDPFLTSLDERIAFLKNLNKTALRITQIPYAVSNQFLQRRSSLYVDSRGNRKEQLQFATYVNFAVTAFNQQKRRMDTRTSEREAQATGWAGATANMESELETAMQEVLRMQQSDPVTPDTYDLVIHPSMLWNLFLETLLPHFDPRQLTERDGRAPGDRWITLSKLNERPLRSQALRLSWDATLPGGLATSKWDDTGHATGSNRLLDENGVVHGIPRSPDLIATDPVYRGGSFPGFNFSRAAAWHTPATVAMPNMILEGGPGKNLNDLIADVDNGLFLKGRGTVMTNPAKTLFRVRPQAAWIIRGGKIAEMVREVEIETTTDQFWSAMEEAGRSEDTFLGGELFPQRAFPLWDTPFSIATPPALFRRIPVYRVEGQS